MTEDSLIQQMRDMRYPGQVDVADSVMAQVASRPLLAPQHPHRMRWIAYAAVACVLLAVGINIALQPVRQFDTRSISGCLAEVYDYHTDYGQNTDAGYYIGVEELFY